MKPLNSSGFFDTKYYELGGFIMLGTSGYGVRTMTVEEFKSHPDRMVGFNSATGKKDIPMLYNKGKNPIRVILKHE